MTKFKLEYVAFLFSMAIPFARASTLLSWQDCVSMATRNNADFQAASAAFDAAQAKVHVARSAFLPTLTVDLDYDKTGFNSTESDSYAASLKLNQNLFAGWQDVGRMRQNTQLAKASNHNVDVVKARISYELKSAFENLRYAKEYAILTGEIIRRRQENLRLVELRFQSGRENKGSVLLSEAYLNQARYDDLQAQNAKRISSAQLKRALGLDQEQDIDITGEIPVQEPIAHRPAFYSMATATPEYEQAKAEEEAANAAVTVSRSQFLPSLNLIGNIGKEDNNFFPESDKRWAIGLNLSFPFFTGGKDYYNMQSEISIRRSATGRRMNSARLVLAKLEQSFAVYNESVLKFKVDMSFKEAVSVRAEIARKRYNNGLLTFEDWDIIESDLIVRQKSFLQSWRDRVVAEAGWEQAQGKGVIP